jgi:excisionase family DNA binding protein
MSDRLAAALEELTAAIREEIRQEAEAATDRPDRLYSVTEAAALLRIGRSSVYQEIGAGRLRSLRVGRRRLIPSSALAERIGPTNGTTGAQTPAIREEVAIAARPPRRD